MKIMSIDYGDQHTGVAFSDPTGSIPGEALVINEWDPVRLADRLAELASDRGAEKIVLGYPLNMDGSAGPRAEKSLGLKELLERRCELEIIMWDERRTTVDAHRIISDNGRHGKRRKQIVDAVAATLILEGYLESMRFTR